MNNNDIVIMPTTEDMEGPEQKNSFDQNPIIKVIGVGGAGGNAISHMIREGLQGAEFIAVNTDMKALQACLAPHRLQLGEKGTGAGTRAEVGRDLAMATHDLIADQIRDADMLFIAAGMGGGTGTGAAPVIAQIAKDLNILTVAVVTKPFVDEGAKKTALAEVGIEELQKSVNALIVVQNEKLLAEMDEDISLADAFAAADSILYNAVSGVSDIILEPGHINVDFEDVRTVMIKGGISMMGSSVAEGPDRAVKAAQQAVNSPLLDGVELSDAQGVLVYVAASQASFKLKEFSAVLKEVQKIASEDAIVKSGMVWADNLGDKMKVTVLVTGLGRPSKAKRRAPRASEDLQREDAFGKPMNSNNTLGHSTTMLGGIGETMNPRMGSMTMGGVGTVGNPSVGGYNPDASSRHESPAVIRHNRRGDSEGLGMEASGLPTVGSNFNKDFSETNSAPLSQTKQMGISGADASMIKSVTNGDLSRYHIPAFMRKQTAEGDK